MKTILWLAICIATSTTSMKGIGMPYFVQPDLQSTHFRVAIDGHESAVAHAAMTYYFSAFALQGSAEISITADADDYWSKGVEVQPWRWGIRPVVNGRTIRFTIRHPMKLSVTRPGDHFAGSEMLFLFADAPETDLPKPDTPGVHYFGPGVYHQNIDAKSGETIYLAPGAVVFGALNVWGAEHVKVRGRGTIVYDGPQDPKHDEGWMHKPNWHVIGMDHARDVNISGIVCIVRSRTWMIQMLSSFGVTFENVKVIGGCPGNANQDGVDWLGGGDSVIRDCFFRASDDIFALYGNWLGYGQEAITTPGETVSNILVEDSVVSTSISNVVRVSWPQKVFDSHNFTMRNTDVIHMGMGGCKVPFGLLEIWSDPAGKGSHSAYVFDNIRLENWYSLLQLRQHEPEIRNIQMRDIWALGDPALVPSVLSGNVQDVLLENVSVPGGLAVETDSGAADPKTTTTAGHAPTFQLSGKGLNLMFRVGTVDRGTRYHWIFGDGTEGEGSRIRHRFQDADGSLRDGSGRFRVLLEAVGEDDHRAWSAQTVAVAKDLAPALKNAATEGGLRLEKKTLGNGQTGYSAEGEGVFRAPRDGGYVFYLMGNDTAELRVDGHLVASSPAPKPQVCGMEGNMVQMAVGSLGLKRGLHRVSLHMTHSTGPDGLAVKWAGPGRVFAGF